MADGAKLLNELEDQFERTESLPDEEERVELSILFHQANDLYNRHPADLTIDQLHSLRKRISDRYENVLKRLDRKNQAA